MALRRRPLPIRCSVATLVCWVMCPTCNEAFADAVASLVLTAYIELDSVRQQKASKVRCWAACFRSCSWQQTVPLQHGFCFGNVCPTWECSRHPFGFGQAWSGSPTQAIACLFDGGEPPGSAEERAHKLFVSDAASRVLLPSRSYACILAHPCRILHVYPCRAYY